MFTEAARFIDCGVGNEMLFVFTTSFLLFLRQKQIIDETYARKSLLQEKYTKNKKIGC